MEKIQGLLPIGSVVQLKDAQKRIVVMGIMPVKHTASGTWITYDYMGVPYPEGYIGTEAGLLFNHSSIQDIIHLGYSDEERDVFLSALERITNSADITISHK